MKKVVATTMTAVMLLTGAPPANADPGNPCWDRYTRQTNPQFCRNNNRPPFGVPGPSPGDQNGGGLFGTIGRVLGGIL